MIECPGCGKLDKVVVIARTITYWNNSRRYKVICKRCNWQGPEKETEEKAIKAWDKRKGET